jgi:hypothetical protein
MIRELALPVMIALLGLAAAAWLYHCVTEHHVHLVIARKVSPSVVVPATRHDTRWHAMSHQARAGANLAMLAAAAGLGLGWQLERTATAAGAAVIMLLAAGWLAVRVLSRAIGTRQHRRTADPDLEE